MILTREQRLNITNKSIPEQYYGFIYKTTFPNGLIYVGQTTKRVYDCLTGDVCEAKFGYFGSGSRCCELIRQFGKELLTRELLVFANSPKSLNILEGYYIKKYNSKNKSIGVNILKNHTNREVGKGNIMFDEEIKAKAKAGRDKFYQTPKGQDLRKKVGEWAKLANSGSNNPNYGNKNNFRGETHPCYGISYKWITNGDQNKRLSIDQEIPDGWRRGQYNSTQVIVFSLNLKFVKIYDSTRQASEFLNIPISSLQNSIYRMETVHGFICRKYNRQLEEKLFCMKSCDEYIDKYDYINIINTMEHE